MTPRIRESDQLRNIRSLHELIPFLRDELDWPIESEDPEEFFVQILDPATGTATFHVEVIEVIFQHLKALWEKGGAATMPILKERGRPARIVGISGRDDRSPFDKRGRPARSPFLDPYSDIAIHEHHLPHWQQDEVFFFVTWRLADSLPANQLADWQAEKDGWIHHHPLPKNRRRPFRDHPPHGRNRRSHRRPRRLARCVFHRVQRSRLMP